MCDIRGESDAFDHIVVELSGVADPKGVRAQFQEAIFYNMPIMERVRLDTMVTVVDCSVFLRHLRSAKVRSWGTRHLCHLYSWPEDPWVMYTISLPIFWQWVVPSVCKPQRNPRIILPRGRRNTRGTRGGQLDGKCAVTVAGSPSCGR